MYSTDVEDCTDRQMKIGGGGRGNDTMILLGFQHPSKDSTGCCWLTNMVGDAEVIFDKAKAKPIS